MKRTATLARATIAAQSEAIRSALRCSLCGRYLPNLDTRCQHGKTDLARIVARDGSIGGVTIA